MVTLSLELTSPSFSVLLDLRPDLRNRSDLEVLSWSTFLDIKLLTALLFPSAPGGEGF